MRRISSQATYVYKRIYPPIWLGFLSVMIVLIVIVGLAGGDLARVVPGVLAISLGLVFSYLMIRRFVLDFIDELWDEGDALIARNDGREARIAIADIVSVGCSRLMPHRVTLWLRRPGAFGSKVTFCAPMRITPFARSAIVYDLMARVEANRPS